MVITEASAQQQVSVDEVLSAILESPNFTVSEYLNTALYDVVEQPSDGGGVTTGVTGNTAATGTSTSSSSSSNQVIHRLTELAVSLQMQTQLCHDNISRVSVELQTILQPRCINDIQRLQTSYSNLLSNDCQQLLSDCAVITNHTTAGSASGDVSASSATGSSAVGGSKTTSVPTDSTATSTTTTTAAASPPPLPPPHHHHHNNNDRDMATMAMETLGTLYALQTNLQRTKEIIIALNVWDITINAISNHIVQHNTNEAVQCLLSLQQSEGTLRGMTMMANHPPEQQSQSQQQQQQQQQTAEQRKATLEKLQLQVTTLLLQPNLQHALSILPQYHTAATADGMTVISPSSITTTTTPSSASVSSLSANSSSLVPIQQCVQLYTQLNQFDTSFMKEYIQQRPTPIHTLWFESYHPSIPNTSASASITGKTTTTGTSATQQQHSMELWLPNYYEHLLLYINEERRLCELIFTHHHNTNSSTTGSSVGGISSSSSSSSSSFPSTIPTILIQIVQECFRKNIVSSFVSRLHTIYNPTIATTAIVSFPMIATLYESTIQFLSLLYQSILSTYMDMIESSSSSKLTSVSNSAAAMELYRKMMSLFITIALPFHEYQGTNYHTIELQYIQTTLQSNIKSIQQVTKQLSNTTDMSIEILQETMDMLQSVTMKEMFPMLATTLQRYELLNGGYYILDTIQMIDKKILHNYMNEIAITVHTLSAYIVQNESRHFISIFEEQHVSIALQILFIVQYMIQSVQQLERTTKEMIVRSCDRVRNHYNKEERMNVVNTTAPSFRLSETLSMVEINTILTKHVADGTGSKNKNIIGNDKDLNNEVIQGTVATLQRLTTTPLLYPTTHDMIQQKLLLSCHTFIFDICYAIPRYYLSTIGTYQTWKLESTQSSSSSNEYGTLPQEYMTHIGEHMLALVQALEPFAMNTDFLKQLHNDDNIDNINSDMIMNPKAIRRVVQPIWIDVLSAIGSNHSNTNNESAVHVLMNGTDLIDYVLGDVVITQPDDVEGPDQGDDDDDVNNKVVTLFCNTWLDVISTAVTGRLIERILRIPLLSNQGCEHLQADLGYIMNVLTALGITGHPHPLLTHIATLATLDETVLRERQDAMKSSNAAQRTMAMNIIQSIEQRFIAMRSF